MPAQGKVFSRSVQFTAPKLHNLIIQALKKSQTFDSAKLL
jgi:hypothetical protein